LTIVEDTTKERMEVQGISPCFWLTSRNEHSV
jgi:hypothetical protein